MATTLEMMVGITALVTNTLIIGIMYFLGNVILAPILYRLEQVVTGPQTIPMWDVTYIINSIWAILLIMEIIIIISFAVIFTRRTVVDDYY